MAKKKGKSIDKPNSTERLSSNNYKKVEKDRKPDHITKKMRTELKKDLKNRFPKKKISILRETEKILKHAWIQQNPSLKINYHPHSNIWFIDPEGNARNQLINAIKYAKKVVCICSFLINDEEIIQALLEANKRGVNVYLLTGTNKFNEKLSLYDPDYKKEQYNKHIDMIKKLSRKILIRCSEHFHAKFLITDPRDENNAQGFISTANFNTLPLTDRLEMIIKLNYLQVFSLFILFSHAFWTDAEYEIYNPERMEKAYNPAFLQDFNNFIRYILKSGIIFTFKEHLKIKDFIFESLQNISDDDEIYMSSYGFDSEHRIFQFIKENAIITSNIYLFTRPRESQIKNIISLDNEAYNILSEDRLHFKCFSISGKSNRSAVFTSNIQTYGLDQGFEVGIILDNDESEILNSILKDWRDNFQYTFKSNIKVSSIQPNTRVLNIEEDEFKEFQILEEYIKDSEESIIVPDLRDYITPQKIIESYEFKLLEQDNSNLFQKNKIFAYITPGLIPTGTEIVKINKTYSILKYKDKTFIGIDSLKRISEIEEITKRIQAPIVFFNPDIVKNR